MKITKFYADNYRNLKNINLTFDEKINVFCGENAQGKTNLLEALHLNSGVRSFRNAKEKDLINFDKQKFDLQLEFCDKYRKQDIKIAIFKNKERNITLNGVQKKNITSIFGNLKCVVFTPLDLELSKGAPENRRDFLDLSIAQIKPSFKDVCLKYDNILTQRNAVLKNIAFGKNKLEELDIWDIQLAKTGSYISLLRYNFVKKLNITAGNLYEKMAEKKEKLTLDYYSSVFSELEGKNDYKEELFEEFYAKLKKNIEYEIKSGFTQIGTHRDDLILKINNLSVKDFGSQGQQRSVALILKLANAYILTEETADFPVLLLDDVLSELDKNRQKFILSSIKDMQVFITCCNSDNLRIKKGKIFIVKSGEVV